MELSDEEGNQLFIPAGYLHGFMTLEPDTEVSYKASSVYHPASEGGVHWRDPDIGVDWPISAEEAVISEKDAVLPYLANFVSPFDYEGAPLELKMIS